MLPVKLMALSKILPEALEALATTSRSDLPKDQLKQLIKLLNYNKVFPSVGMNLTNGRNF